jgi:hypothetical protein
MLATSPPLRRRTTVEKELAAPVVSIGTSALFQAPRRTRIGR